MRASLTEIALRRVVPDPSPSMVRVARACDHVKAHAHVRAAHRRTLLIDVVSVTRGAHIGNAFAQALGVQ